MPPTEPWADDRFLCRMYAVFAAIGTLVMGTLAVAFVLRHAEDGPIGVMDDFLRDATHNLASCFVYADLALIWAALGAYQIIEARRWRIRHVWAYIVGAPALALIASFSIFMYVRQRRIAAARTTPAPQPAPAAPAVKEPQR
ncbi:DUF2834 domain-containing protein [Streptomyces sp. NRRL WC-3742]|uniref:DUF2834 domain-containing protein n=1 Tax=Streptomyces sp. NRRL WC-3742 TaxID=1463934 RepID=UPI00068AB124|nr:DUF2834 domain-containing protein [Streptomyces sp. NRRL WC-3742]